MTRDEQLIKAALDMAAETCEQSAYAADADGHHFAYSIRAIDVDEVLKKVAWRGPGEIAHRYSPDWMAQGDCQICGHTQEAHQPAPDAVARLGEAMKHLHNIINCGNCSGSRQSARLALRALAAMDTNHD